MTTKAFFLNFTLKKSPHVPSAQAPVDMSAVIFREPDFESEETTVMDRNAASGISDVREGSEDFSEKMIGKYSLIGRLQDSLSRELKATHTMYSISNTTGHILQSDISSLFKENPIRINLEDLLRKQRRQKNEVLQPECRDFILQEFLNIFTETLITD